MVGRSFGVPRPVLVKVYSQCKLQRCIFVFEFVAGNTLYVYAHEHTLTSTLTHTSGMGKSTVIG